MRPDLAKCTTEHPRSGGIYSSDNKYGGKVPVHPDPEHDYLDEYGGYRSSARRRHHNCKEFTDALGALRGNIRKNVGRPWSDVYSEFSQNLDRRGISGYHIWTHLMMEVETKTYLGVDGKIYSYGRYGWNGETTGYYVHPITGILEYRPYVSWRTRKRNKKVPIKDLLIPLPGEDGWKYCLIDGLWFKTRTVRKEYKYDWMEHPSVIEVQEKKSANRKEISWIKAQIGVL